MSDLTSVQRPISELSITSKVLIPGTPDWIGIDESAVWISNSAKNTLVRVDAATNQVSNVVAVGSKPCSGLGGGFGSVWVPCCGERQIYRVDRQTSEVMARVPVPVADSEGGIGGDADSVGVVTNQQGTLVRL